MPTKIAEYFTDELSEWKGLLATYSYEMHELTRKLAEVIQRNTVPHIAGKVESQQDKLNKVFQSFNRLQELFLQQEEALKKDSALIEDSLIKAETEKLQKELRQGMQNAEKEYIDAKYEVHNFLSGILK